MIRISYFFLLMFSLENVVRVKDWTRHSRKIDNFPFFFCAKAGYSSAINYHHHWPGQGHRRRRRKGLIMTNGRRGERTKGRIYRACLNSTSDVTHTHLTTFPIIVWKQKEVQKEVAKQRQRLLPRPRLQLIHWRKYKKYKEEAGNYLRADSCFLVKYGAWR